VMCTCDHESRYSGRLARSGSNRTICGQNMTVLIAPDIANSGSGRQSRRRTRRNTDVFSVCGGADVGRSSDFALRDRAATGIRMFEDQTAESGA
jgi:hypothetical protein